MTPELICNVLKALEQTGQAFVGLDSEVEEEGGEGNANYVNICLTATVFSHLTPKSNITYVSSVNNKHRKPHPGQVNGSYVTNCFNQIWWICYMAQFFHKFLIFSKDNDVVIGQVIYQIVATQVLFQTE